jgi:serine/threonine-protein kinase
LLLGILGLQEAFFTRAALTSALEAWAQQQAKPLGQVLQERGELTLERLATLEALVDAYIGAHGPDPQHCLATLPPSLVEGFRQLAGTGAGASAESDAVTCTVPPTPFDRRGDSGGRPAIAPHLDAASSSDRYHILRTHARGGLGEVFVALDQELRREVALKQIQEQFADHTASRTRFVREAEITGGLEHPGVVPVYGLGQYADGRPFYAMRFIRGDSFKDAIERFHHAEGGRRPLDQRMLELRQLLGRFIAVCNTMAYAHSRGVVHRDLKPANVMLGSYGETLVVDWGLAKQFERKEEEQAGVASTPPATHSVRRRS